MTIQHLLTGAVLFIILVSATALNEHRFCVKYFGTVEAFLELADAIPEYNYNGTIDCPRSYPFPTVSGAILEICPPAVYQDNGTVLTASLRLNPAGPVYLPIDRLNLGINLITNGSVTGPFENNGQPAVLAKDDEESKPFLPVWTIIGTQGSLNEYPSFSDFPTLSVVFSCENIPATSIHRYCGLYKDQYGVGCWTQQEFDWNMQNPLNYTIRFGPAGASVEINTADEYTYQDTYAGPDGIRDVVRTASYTRAFLEFRGDILVPSISDYDFWENAAQTHETETANNNYIKLVEDATGMPVFVNGSNRQDWYAAKNGTFSNDVPGSSVRSGIVSFVLLGSIVTSIGMLFV